MASSEIPMTLWIHCSEENASMYGRKKELSHQKFTTHKMSRSDIPLPQGGSRRKQRPLMAETRAESLILVLLVVETTQGLRTSSYFLKSFCQGLYPAHRVPWDGDWIP